MLAKKSLDPPQLFFAKTRQNTFSTILLFEASTKVFLASWVSISHKLHCRFPKTNFCDHEVHLESSNERVSLTNVFEMGRTAKILKEFGNPLWYSDYLPTSILPAPEEC